MTNHSSKNRLITIVGVTAIGKTALSIALAEHFNCAVLSCDSRQFYKEMRIGTGVPTTAELAKVPHYFIQHKSVFEPYNVGQFEKEALATLGPLFKKNPTQIMVGGSGLYADAVIEGLDYFPKISSEIRKNLQEQLTQKGLPFLQKQLKERDKQSYRTIALDNPHRVIRALEICIGTGMPYASFKNKPKIPRDFKAMKIGLTANREVLYQRINRRVDIMMASGLLEEAKKMYPYKSVNALQTVGYSELFSYFEGKFTLEFAISEIKKNTRRFAKRQLTWFRKDPTILWFDFQESVNKIIEATC